jgi:tetratricopeptide (TPR) repeat protein
MFRRCLSCLLPAIAMTLSMAHPAVAAQDEERHLAAVIRAAQRDRDFERVAQAYRRVVSLHPNDAAAWQGLGVAQVLLHQYAEAIPALERAVQLDATLWGAALYLGMSYYRTNRFDHAKKSLESALRLKPEDAAVHYWLGASHNATRTYPSAISELRTAAKAAPEDRETMYLLARSYAEYAAELEQRLLEEASNSPWAARLRAADAVDVESRAAASAELQRAIRQSRDTPGLHLDLGLVLWDEKRYAEAAAAFRKELAIDAWSVEARSRLAAYLLETGHPAEAALHLQTALTLRPGDPEATSLSRMVEVPPHEAAPHADTSCASAAECLSKANLRRALELLDREVSRPAAKRTLQRRLILAYLASGRTEDAFTRSADLLLRTPGDAESMFLLARACQALSRQTAERILSKYPDSARARMMRGEAFERQRGQNYQRALAEYLAALEAEPDIVGANYAAGRVLWKLQRYQDAARHLNLELARNPHHSGAHYYLGRTFQMLGDPARAVQHLEASLGGGSDLPESWRALARAQMEIGRPEAAVESYRKALARSPDDPGLHALLGSAYKAAGNPEEARKAFEISRRLSASRSSQASEAAPQ